MKRSILAFLFVLSILFNVFFVLGAAVKSRPAVADEPQQSDLVQRVADRLQLTSEQQWMFSELRENFENETAVLSQHIALVRGSIAAELEAGDSPNLERLRELAEREAELHKQRRLAGAQMFKEFVSVLTQQQREKLGHRIGPARSGPGMRPLDLNRFDTNKDGTIDPDELEAAQSRFNERCQELHRGRPDWSRRFDINQNGQLELDEQKAMREAIRNRHERGPGPGEGRDGRRSPRHDDSRPAAPGQSEN